MAIVGAAVKSHESALGCTTRRDLDPQSQSEQRACQFWDRACEAQAASALNRGTVSDKTRGPCLHVTLTIKLSWQIYAKLGDVSKTMPKGQLPHGKSHGSRATSAIARPISRVVPVGVDPNPAMC